MSRISNSSFLVNSNLEQVVAVNGSVDVTASTELPMNLKQVDGVTVQLGQTAMSSSFPVNIASDQTDLLTDLNKVGGSPFGQGQNTMTSSISVAIASDQPDLLTDVSKFGGISVNIGEQVMSDSIPVVIASDQNAIPVTISSSSTNSGSEGNLDNATVVASGDFSSEVDVDGKKNLTITGSTTDIGGNPIEIYVNHTSLGTKYKYQYDIYPDGSGNFSENLQNVAINYISLKYTVGATVTASVFSN